tara:strand:- start:50 stop:667 length:618 start_codon:yes stop_codon:yes gene_type:complete
MVNKVIGVGLQKTGTSSLRTAYDILGLERGHWGADRLTTINDAELLSKTIEITHGVQACANNPWPKYYRELSETFPNAQFILTVRDEVDWAKSCSKYFQDRDWPELDWFYGVGHYAGNEDVFLDRYRQHNRDVQDFFQGQPGRLLVFNPTEGEGWKELCDFIGVEVPNVPFPHSNAGGSFRAAVQQRYVPWAAKLIKLADPVLGA